MRELQDQAWRTRFGQHRADRKYQPIDLIMWAAPYAALAGGIFLLMKNGGARR